MKLFILFSALASLLLSNSDCNKKEEKTYKGRLEIKAICFNYTIGVIGGNIDTALVVANWTDENTGKSYRNAFRLGSPCNFPKTLNQGDEFYFKIDTTSNQDCPVCMAYYPTPAKALQIRVVEK